MKNWQSAEQTQFRVGQVAILRAMLPDFPKEDGEATSEAWADYDVLFRGAHPLKDLELSVPEALRRFQEWLLSNYVRPHMSAQEFLSVSIERQLGRDKVTFTLGAHFDIHSGAGRSANYDRLVDAINVELGRYERDRAKGSDSSSDAKADNTVGASQVQVQAVRLEVSMEKGKRRYNVTCGEWQKHGVPFYAEHIKAGGVEPDDIPDAGWDLSNYDAVIQMNGSSPKRVLRLVKHAT